MNAIQTQIAGIVAVITAAMGNFTGGVQDVVASIGDHIAGSSQNITATANAATPASSGSNVNTTSVFLAINEYRARHGVAPVAPNPQLNGIAQRWADHMAQTGVPAHNPSYLQQYPAGWKEGGENVHQNWRGASTQEVVQAWHNSPSHRQNQADPGFNQIGVGVAYGADGRMYVVTNYMR
ncbi:CAP domain-containing protein [Corynebacterium ammoniagenes]|jgi:uncharacterized protein YkwD|uniref:SCP domain-containing protein n=2 Tax=Corynebacterium ammoniagenes TaxID=1697 RepID=A0AAV5G9X0_CORAM|nr:CAP domain-containing protein [Corynebacterium ammoniagenes]APT83432.1 hypothetical protein CAMM_11160 [Corynebacterium ammoniagenes DSM 20306]AQS74436.1 hypothetical protein CA40472_11485 [Corynebacterium ammoniagenes]EFG81306.1 SCP-like protein [Corynebacterium ammoniagenes DSM 20306]NMF32182.1 CAP domain-containing protein [Corynebacterium ammoniagenes]GJN43107.1 hypothetical protein CAT723_15860 [Corynebacterium ammoniagenes]